MKKFKVELIGLIIVSILFGYFLGLEAGKTKKFNEIVNRAKSLPEDQNFYSSQEIDFLLYNAKIDNWQNYAKDLQSEGWSKAAAEKIAKVEFKLLPIDNEYNNLIND